MKYKILNDDYISYDNKTLYRIQALKDFADVKAGDIGGFIEHEQNLSQEGNARVFGDMKITHNNIHLLKLFNTGIISKVLLEALTLA